MDQLLGVVAVDHVGVAVADLDAAVAFYTDTLGLVVLHREVNEGQVVSEAMLGAPGSAPGAAVLQLVAPSGPDSPLQRFLQRSGPGLQHLAYRVGDLEATCAQLRQRGVGLLYAHPQHGTAGSRINFIHPRATGGVLIELVEPYEVVSDRAPGGTTGQPPHRPREDPR